MRRAKSRLPIHGVLLADKPVGPSSTQHLGHIKFLFQAQKAGHGGTLDPLASGLLPLLFGEATKFAQEGLDADKGYRASIRLGQTTDTGDAEGQVTATASVSVTDQEVLQAVAAQRGPQLQVPPMYSALKRDGRPLYEYARAGIELDRPSRPIEVYEARLVSSALPDLVVDYLVSKGSYIRVLAESLGAALGTGAHLTALRRTQVGRLHIEEGVTLEAIEACPPEARAGLLRPVDYLIQDWPTVTLLEAQTHLFGHGQAPQLTSNQIQETMVGGAPFAQRSDVGVSPSPAKRIRVLGPDQRFLGVGHLIDNHLKPLRLVAEAGSH